MSERSRRILFILVLPVATVAGVIGPIAVAWSDLPDRLATRWSVDGSVTGSLSPAAFLATQAAAAGLAVALFLVAGLQLPIKRIYRALAAVIAASIGPTFAVASVFVVGANRGVADWEQIPGPGPWWILWFTIASLAGIVPIGWLVRDLFRTPTPPLDTQPSAGLSGAATEAAAWYSGASARWPFLIAVPMGLLGLVAVTGVLTGMTDSTEFGGAIGLTTGLLLLAIALLTLAFATISVGVDRRGLTINYGILPWPRTTVDLQNIESAHVVDVRPMEHGGWGYRGSRILFGKAAVVVRGGEGIRLGLADGNEFVVTVDDATQGAGVLNDLRRVRSPR